jgi:hypothetical protein
MLPVLRTAALVAFVLTFASVTPVRAVDGHWQPPRIAPTTATLAEVFAKRDAASGTPSAAYARRVERWVVRTNGNQYETTVTVRDGDVRFDTPLAGATYSEGRAGGLRWRETPNGLVRVIASDVQGDQLDRWPLAIFPYDAADCRLIGETETEPRRYVVEYRPAHDSPHWFFFDAASGALTNETAHEGSRTYSFAFSDSRTFEGAARPFGWHTDGWGDDEDVRVDDVRPQDVAEASVALPPSRTDALATLEQSEVDVPARFDTNQRIYIDGTINGHRAHFIFDTGTTQILIDGAAAKRFGIRNDLGHGIAGELSTGPVHFKNLAIETTSLDHFQADGILGYDYFAGHIVHLDYAHGRLSFARRDTFSAPANASEMGIDYREGMPLATAAVGPVRSSRIVLDTGSQNAVFLRPFFQTQKTTPAQLGFSLLGTTSGIGFLEGPIVVENATLPELRFAGESFRDSSVQLEIQSPAEAVDFPIDGIFGTQVLDKFEWWFDYDGSRCWVLYT